MTAGAMVSLGLMLAVGGAQAAVVPPNWPDFQVPDPPAQAEPLGARLSRAMYLLASSTPQHRNHVRVLYYGQSITAQPWTGFVTEYLKATFPNADIHAENRAIGGFTAPSLVRTAEYDLYSYHPDLLIFHVYGGDTTGELEQIIQRVRQRTNADILIRTPHLRWSTEVPRDGSADDPKIKGADASDEQQAVKVRELAAKYGLELADTRNGWRDYLPKHNLLPKDLLADGIHLNELGNKLMASLVIPHLRPTPNVDPATWKDTIQDLPVGGPAVKQGGDGSLTVSFTGNRLDLIAAPSTAKLGTAKLLIDGQPAAENQDLYTTSRPSKSYGVWWPAIALPGHTAPRVLEHWTLRVTKVDAEAKDFWFTVTGSKTGPDGEGQRSKRFVSNSGRVVLEPKDWWLDATPRYPKPTVLPEGFQVTWDVLPLYLEPYQAVAATDPTCETVTTLVTGLSNGPHTLTLVPNGDGAVPVAAFRAYAPPLKG